MDADNILVGDSLQSQRIGLAQVLLGCKGQLFKIRLRLDIVDIQVAEFLFVKAVDAIIRCVSCFLINSNCSCFIFMGTHCPSLMPGRLL